MPAPPPPSIRRRIRPPAAACARARRRRRPSLRQALAAAAAAGVAYHSASLRLSWTMPARGTEPDPTGLSALPEQIRVPRVAEMAALPRPPPWFPDTFDLAARFREQRASYGRWPALVAGEQVTAATAQARNWSWEPGAGLRHGILQMPLTGTAASAAELPTLAPAPAHARDAPARYIELASRGGLQALLTAEAYAAAGHPVELHLVSPTFPPSLRLQYEIDRDGVAVSVPAAPSCVHVQPHGRGGRAATELTGLVTELMALAAARDARFNLTAWGSGEELLARLSPAAPQLARIVPGAPLARCTAGCANVAIGLDADGCFALWLPAAGAIDPARDLVRTPLLTALVRPSVLERLRARWSGRVGAALARLPADTPPAVTRSLLARRFPPISWAEDSVARLWALHGLPGSRQQPMAGLPAAALREARASALTTLLVHGDAEPASLPVHGDAEPATLPV